MVVCSWCACADGRFRDYITKVLQMVSSESKGVGALLELTDNIPSHFPLLSAMSYKNQPSARFGLIYMK